MSRYVNKKHGLIIGSGNIFFITNDKRAPEGVPQFRDGYRAIVWARSYTFDNPNSANVIVKTAANQLLWRDVVVPGTKKIGEIEYPWNFHYSLLTSWAEWRLNEIGEKYKDWDVRTFGETGETQPIFFKRRKDALKFVNIIDVMLKGITYF